MYRADCKEVKDARAKITLYIIEILIKSVTKLYLAISLSKGRPDEGELDLKTI